MVTSALPSSSTARRACNARPNSTAGSSAVLRNPERASYPARSRNGGDEPPPPTPPPPPANAPQKRRKKLTPPAPALAGGGHGQPLCPHPAAASPGPARRRGPR